MSTPSTTGSLADIANPDGIFAIIAMDQRNTLRRMFSAVGIDATDDDLVTAKKPSPKGKGSSSRAGAHAAAPTHSRFIAVPGGPESLVIDTKRARSPARRSCCCRSAIRRLRTGQAAAHCV